MTERTIKVAFFFAWGSIAVAQSTARIEGHVLSQSGEPVRKASVRLQGGPSSVGYIEVSDAGGGFVFADLPPGRYTLSASKPGFIAPRSNGISYSNLTVQAGEVKKDTEFRLVQLGVISGRVTDQDGDPVIGVQVLAFHVQYNNGHRQLAPYTTVASDDQGNFRIANVEPGRYYPVADDARRVSSGSNFGEEHRGRTAQEVDITTFYPGSPDFSGAVAVDVAAGKESQGLNIRMLRGRVFSIRGMVDGRSATPPVSTQLTLIAKTNGIGTTMNRMGATAQQSSGTFEFRGLLPGSYVIQGQRGAQVLREGGTTVTAAGLTGRTEVTISNSDVDGVIFSLSPAGEITGTVRLEDGDLQALRKNGAHGQVGLTDAEETTGLFANSQVQENGTFKIQNFGFSRYWVSIRPMPPGTYVKSIRFGGQDVTKVPLDLTSGAGGVLDVVLSQRAAEVTALVHKSNGESVPGVTVSVWPKSAAILNPQSVWTFSTGPSGNVKIADLPPGEYYVAAWEESDSNLIRYPDFLSRFTDLATPARLSESDKITTDLMLIPKDRIAAEVAKLP